MTMARVNVTWQGQNGDLPDPVLLDATDAEVLGWVTEAVQTGGIPGIRVDAGADFEGFVVDRFTADDAHPARLFVRPKTPFGRC
jgi:hypothetical protein